MVLALGSLAMNDQIEPMQNWAAEYAQPAFSLLPAVILQNDLTAVHCLILFSIYYMWLVKPAHVFNFIGMASMKIQHLVHWYVPPMQSPNSANIHPPPSFPCFSMLCFRCSGGNVRRTQNDTSAYENSEEHELERRAYWTIYLIER